MAPRAREVAGVVRALLPRALYRVELESRHQVTAHAASGVRRNFVRLLEGDRVMVELMATDVTRGRITRRVVE
jgi:translation initiation factor IF-1